MKDVSGVQDTEIFLSPKNQRAYKSSKKIRGEGVYLKIVVPDLYQSQTSSLFLHTICLNFSNCNFSEFAIEMTGSNN